MIRFNEKLRPENVVYIKSFGDYIKVFTKEGFTIHHDTMKRLEKVLPEHYFQRVHRGYIVNIEHIKSVTDCEIRFFVIDDIVTAVPGKLRPLYNKINRLTNH